jgi:PAS domain S-box-containing protein
MRSDLVMSGSYDYGLVAVSILIAMLGSYATINLAGRIESNRGVALLYWAIGGAIAMATGTWAMHYTGMLAFHLPVPISYDWPTALLSFLASLLSSALALIVVVRPQMRSPRAFVASVFIGGGIAALHYTGMDSMRFQGMHRYSPAMVTLSVLLAILFALLSVWLMFLFRHEPDGWKLRKMGSVALLGTSIWCMHYTGMASASFVASAAQPDLTHAVSISLLGTLGIGAVAVAVLAAVLLTATWDRLQKRRILLDELFEQAPQAVVLMTADYEVVRVNREFTKLFGYDPKEIIGESLRELIVPAESQLESQQIIERVERGERVEAEAIRQHKDGSRFYVSIVHVPVSLPGGKAARYAIYRDITERKQAEEALHEAHSRIESVLNSVADIHILFDREWRYLYVNEAAVEAIGLSREAVLGHKLWELFPDITGTELDRQYRRAMDEQIRVAFEYHYPTTDTWWENRFYPSPAGLSVFATNITERKVAEEKTKATSLQLRALSARLQSAREEEATRIAREIHDELGAALSSLRWDLEDIAEAVSSSAEQLQVEELRDRIPAMINLIDTTINTVRRIASELRPIALDALGLRETIEWQARQFYERTGIIVECDFDQDSIDLMGEQATAVFRIFQEALTNILRHAQATKVSIEVNNEDGGFRLTIRDNGRGITDQEKSSRRALGLLGMRERANLIGGSVEITGSEGNGTAVTVRVPVQPGE